MLLKLKQKDGIHHATILHHDIAWKCDNKTVKNLDESAIDDIIYQIQQGLTSSEFTITYGKNGKKETKGWWEIVNWKKIALELYSGAGSRRDFDAACKLFEDNWS